MKIVGPSGASKPTEIFSWSDGTSFKTLFTLSFWRVIVGKDWLYRVVSGGWTAWRHLWKETWLFEIGQGGGNLSVGLSKWIYF